MFYALTQNEEFYEERINLFVALAPVTRLKVVNDKIVDSLSKFHDLIYHLLLNPLLIAKYEFHGPELE
jgi:hypothetical protein